MSSLVLSLDTSTPWMSAALLSQDASGLTVLATREAGPPQIVSTLIPGVFDELLAAAGKDRSQVGALVVGLGPGLFTGMRVAMATMKSVAYARRLPLMGAGTLEAMALSVARGGVALAGERIEETTATSGLLCPVLDARKGEVYFALYRIRGLDVEEVLAPEAAPPARFVEVLSLQRESAIAFGSGVTPAGALPSHVQTLAAPRGPHAAELAALALFRQPRPSFDAAQVLSLEPTYLRPPEAEVARRKREGL